MNYFNPGSTPAPAELPVRGNEAMEVVRHRRDDLVRCIDAVRRNELMNKTADVALTRSAAPVVPGAQATMNPLFHVQKVMENSFAPKAEAFPAGAQPATNPVEWQPQPYVPADTPLVETAPLAPAETAVVVDQNDPVARARQIIDQEAASSLDYNVGEAA